MTLQGWRDRLILFAPFLAFMLLAVVSPSDDGPTICPFALATGTACPGCGMTRAASRLIHGDIAGALRYHPLIPIILIEAVVGWVWFLLRRQGKIEPMSNRTLNIILVATAVSLVVVWALRIATGTLPPV